MAHKTSFQKPPEKPDFSFEEDKVFDYWNQIDAFQLSIKKSEGRPQYSFFDGPPFATGMPHYGHICAGTIKDIVCRYAYQSGYSVERRFGWDCHGLPIEYEIDKTFNLMNHEDYQKFGIANYNKECRAIVMRYSKEWEQIVSRFGRWIDFKNDYKTMDLTFMESVWHVFKTLFDKNLVYRGCKIMPYSTTCKTVLSNFEASQNYKDVNDPSVFVSFPLVKDPNVKMVAWTTTPWTLPSNCLLAVNPQFDYIKIKLKKTGEIFILAECRVQELMGKDKNGYEVLAKMKGQELEGQEYVPLYEYFGYLRESGCFRIYAADFVTSDTGTGVVHCAPAFGEEDYKLCVKKKVIKPDSPPCPLDQNGRFVDPVTEFKGKYIKEADTEIKRDLKKKGRLISESQIKHSYPFCWRSDTPLIYKAHHSWFIKVTDMKQDLLANNKKAYWVPTFAQEKRFNNWLENAEDWCFSRNRIWGNPIPLWVSDDFEEIVCIGSIDELKKLSGVENITDLHREYIDQITIPSKMGKGQLRRIEEVFDCWFESGSMPFAQSHYPFGISEENFNKRFPADFIGEGLDQTRGWFYTLNVIATGMKNTNPYKNLIVNGLVLAQDGKKMSKRLKNYPDPMEVVKHFGADAIRLYLANSPLVRAQSLNFNQQGVKNVVKEIFLPWYNAYRFLIQNITRWELDNGKTFQFDEKLAEDQKNLSNYLDRWIMASCQNLIRLVKEEMKQYKLYTVVPKLLTFLEQLTNWYVRLNRGRIKGELTEFDRIISLNILFDVLLKSSILMAAFVPFITDMMYQNFKKVIPQDSKYFQESIHFLIIPEPNMSLIDEQIEETVNNMQNVIEVSRQLREKKQISLKQPIQALTIYHKDEQTLKNLQPTIIYIQDEMNVAEVQFSTDIKNYLKLVPLPNNQLLGQKLKKQFNSKLIESIKNMSQKEIAQFQQDGKITISGIEFEADDIQIKDSYEGADLPEYCALGGGQSFGVLLDTRQNEKLKQIGLVREITTRVQKMKKSAGLFVEDLIVVFYESDSQVICNAIQEQKDFLNNIIKKPVLQMNCKQEHYPIIKDQEFTIQEGSFKIVLCWEVAGFFQDKLLQKYGDIAKDLQKVVLSYDIINLRKQIKENNGLFKFTLNNQDYTLIENEDFFLNH